MQRLNIFHIASECVPFAKTGGLADVVGTLPIAISQLGHSVHVVLPAYKGTLSKFGSSLRTYPVKARVDDENMQGEIHEVDTGQGITFLLIDQPGYFHREHLYGPPGKDYQDNLDRYTFFCKAFLELLPKFTHKPDIIHCHDWQTSLIPLYLKSIYSNHDYYQSIRTVYTIHNLGYQGIFPGDEFPKVGVPEAYFSINGIEYYNKINLMKGGILFSDKITTVSRKYSQEIQTSEYGCGLEGVLNVRREDLTGIINGIDYNTWNPTTDKLIPHNYSTDNLENKLKCKEFLFNRFQMKGNSNTPLIGIISRLVDQKGFDILAESFNKLMSMDLFFVLLGTGDDKYHKLFTEFKQKYPHKTGITLTFDNQLAHQIEAGTDIFLMPSKYEPCGLNQMISLKYGTVPVVRSTGGLDDTILDYTSDPSRGNGFKFTRYSARNLVQKINEALKLFQDKPKWHELQQRCMKQDHSWAVSAKNYIKLYLRLTG